MRTFIDSVGSGTVSEFGFSGGLSVMRIIIDIPRNSGRPTTQLTYKSNDIYVRDKHSSECAVVALSLGSGSASLTTSPRDNSSATDEVSRNSADVSYPV